MRIARHLLLVSLLAAFTSAQADAGLIVTVGDLSLSPENPTGQLSVFVQAQPGTTFSLSMFSLGLQITPTNPASTGQVAFVTPLTDAQFTNPDYVFFGNSLAELFPPSGAVFPTVYANDSYLGGDGAIFGDVLVDAFTPRLLLRTGVTMLTASPPVPGEGFTVSVVGGGFTQFILGNGDVLPDSQVEPRAGTVATPEPATLAVFGAFAAVGVGLRRRFSRQASAG